MRKKILRPPTELYHRAYGVIVNGQRGSKWGAKTTSSRIKIGAFFSRALAIAIL